MKKIIGAGGAGKAMTAILPNGAAYAVHDEEGMGINYSTITHNNTTVLPASCKVAFIGRAGDVFVIELQ